MSEILILNESNYAQATASGTVAVDFYADWCGPCKMMAPTFDQAKDDYAGRVTFAKLNVDEAKTIALENKVLGIPTLIFYKDGQIADRVTGVVDKATLYAKLDALL
ncbi:MAG: thioredoxin [Clostridiales Family XIII bacterium]|jgi:thioredoxin 1|nr:thioredoxin [Clostridiales Family XIII bacterium]